MGQELTFMSGPWRAPSRTPGARAGYRRQPATMRLLSKACASYGPERRARAETGTGFLEWPVALEPLWRP